jgi:ribonuclease P protein component
LTKPQPCGIINRCLFDLTPYLPIKDERKRDAKEDIPTKNTAQITSTWFSLQNGNCRWANRIEAPPAERSPSIDSAQEQSCQACALVEADYKQGSWVNRSCRLTRSTDFQRVRRIGKSYAHPFVVLLITRNDNSLVRIGVSAGLSVGKAVDRNRAKRRLRHIFSSLYPRLSKGFDLVVVARKPIVTAPFDSVISAVENLLIKANLL